VLAYTGDLTLVLFVEEDEGPLLSADGKDRLVDGPVTHSWNTSIVSWMSLQRDSLRQWQMTSPS